VVVVVRRRGDERRRGVARDRLRLGRSWRRCDRSGDRRGHRYRDRDGNPVGPEPDGAKSASGQPGAPFERPGRVDASGDTNEWQMPLEEREPAVEELVA
jgi:hypothetical protein